MIKNFKVNQCRYIATNDLYDVRINNWSRRYEWWYAYLAACVDNPHSILNAACGESEIHGQFNNLLDSIGTLVYNCDIARSPINTKFKNFFQHDILKPFGTKYDHVYCISTIEDFVSPKLTAEAIENLWEATGQRLIITADIYDKVRPEWFSEPLGLAAPILPPNALNGGNSGYAQHEFAHINILLVDISYDPT